MPIFKSKPHSIEAFQFAGLKTNFPTWFLDLRVIGKATVTIGNHKIDDCIKIYYDDGDFRTIKIGQWVARNSTKTVFKLKNEEIIEGFELHDV